MRFSRMSAIALTVTAAIGGSGASASLASAATAGTPTEIINFGATPDPITFGNSAVTLSGQLVESAAPSTGIGNEPITVQEWVVPGQGATFVHGTTASDGTFSIALGTLPAGGAFYASFGGDSSGGYGSGVSTELSLPATAAPSQVTLSVQPAQPVVWAGTTLTFSGKVQAKLPSGKWAPVSGAVIEGPIVPAGIRTGADGTFSWKARVDRSSDASTYVTALPWQGNYYGLFAQSYSSLAHYTVQYDTRFSGIAATTKSGLKIYGNVQYDNSVRWGAAASVEVELFHRATATGKWLAVEATKANSSGAFAFYPKVKSAAGYWQARIARQQLAPGLYLPSTSKILYHR